MPIITQPGQEDAIELSGSSDSFIIPGEVFPNQQISVTVTLNRILGGASPSITVSIDQLNPNGEGWTSIWNSGALNSNGQSVGPATVNPPGGASAFDPSELRLSWSTVGTPTEVDFTPNVTAS